MKTAPNLLTLSLHKKGLIASLALFGFLLAINCSSQENDDYFSLVAVVSDGRLTRFVKLPITVYVEGLEVQGKEYAADLQYALEVWESRSDGVLKFALVNSPDGANILVSWVRELEDIDQEHPLGVSELQRTGRDEFSVEMSIALRNRKTREPLTHEQMKTVLLHEFGHAVGLWGHSKDEEDVMYHAATALDLTQRDINTLKLVYSHEPGYSLHAESIAAIKQEMRSKLENAGLYFLLGAVYADQGNYDQAVDNFKRCLHLNPQFHKASSALAAAYHSSGQEQAALTEYLSLAESNPSAAVHNMLGALYFEKKDDAKAIQHFKKALDLDRTYQSASKNLFKVYLHKGKEYVNAGAYQEAVALLLDGVKLFPDTPELHNTLGTAYAGMNQFQEAIKEYSKALQVNPAFTLARINMASCYNNQGVKYAEADLWNRAIEAYTQALKLMPDMAEAEKNLSSAYWNQASRLSKMGQNAEAIIAYQNFLERKPNSKEAYNNLGAIYFRMDNHEAAISAFKRALEIDPEDNGLRDNLAIAYHKYGIDLISKKSYSQAITEIEKGLKIAPDKAGLHLAMAQAYQRLGKWDDAARHIDKALLLDPDGESARKMMVALEIYQGEELLQSGKYDQALEHYARVPADLAPAALYNNIGYIYIMKGQDLEAIDEFDKVLKLEPLNKTAHQNLINVKDRFNKALSRDPGSRQARDKLARVRLSLAMSHMGRGSLDEAKKVLESALDLRPQDQNLRHSLAEGCRKLAEEFLKSKDGLREARELKNLADQLTSVRYNK